MGGGHRLPAWGLGPPGPSSHLVLVDQRLQRGGAVVDVQGGHVRQKVVARLRACVGARAGRPGQADSGAMRKRGSSAKRLALGCLARPLPFHCWQQADACLAHGPAAPS